MRTIICVVLLLAFGGSFATACPAPAVALAAPQSYCPAPAPQGDPALGAPLSAPTTYVPQLLAVNTGYYNRTVAIVNNGYRTRNAVAIVNHNAVAIVRGRTRAVAITDVPVVKVQARRGFFGLRGGNVTVQAGPAVAVKIGGNSPAVAVKAGGKGGVTKVKVGRARRR